MTLAEALPGVNASLNAASACALFTGYWAIRTRRLSLHWKCMATAFAASSLFLVGYLTRYALTGIHHYAGPGRGFYLVLLGTHTLLAALALPLILQNHVAVGGPPFVCGTSSHRGVDLSGVGLRFRDGCPCLRHALPLIDTAQWPSASSRPASAAPPA